MGDGGLGNISSPLLPYKILSVLLISLLGYISVVTASSRILGDMAVCGLSLTSFFWSPEI